MPKSKKTKGSARKAKPKGVKSARKTPKRINGVGTGTGGGVSPGLIGALPPGVGG